MKPKHPVKCGDGSTARVEIPLSPESIAYLKTKERTWIYTVTPLAQTYLEVLEEFQSSRLISVHEPPKSSSFIPFVVTAAAALECLLNDNLIMHSNYVFGLSSNNQFARAFLSMSLRGKLDTIIPLLTSNRYVMRHDNSTYQQLSRLIRLRNDLMHGKSAVKEHDVSIQHYDQEGIGFSVELPKMAYQDIDANDCATFLRALKELNGLLSSHKTWPSDQPVPEEFQGMLRKLPPR